MNFSEYRYMAPLLCYEIQAWETIFKDRKAVVFKAGQFIRRQGSEDKDIFIVESGYFIVTCVLEDGTQTIQHLGGPGCAFGYISVDTERPYMSSAQAVTECRGYIISRQEVLAYREKDASFLRNLLIQENEKCQLYFSRILLLAIPDTCNRILSLFLGFCAGIGIEEEDGYLIPLELTHQLISEILLVSRVTVSRCISQCQKQGYLIKKGKYFKVNAKKIMEIL